MRSGWEKEGSTTVTFALRTASLVEARGMHDRRCTEQHGIGALPQRHALSRCATAEVDAGIVVKR